MASSPRAVLITTAARANRVRSKKTGHKKRTDVWFHRFQGCFINTTTQRLISSRRIRLSSSSRNTHSAFNLNPVRAVSDHITATRASLRWRRTRARHARRRE